jgi:hypothetical protein
MIGVAANSTDLETAAEFFELFKTPWQPAIPGRRYRVVFSATGCVDHLAADVYLLYGSGEQASDRKAGIAVEQISGPLDAEWAASTFPIYGRAGAFEVGAPLLRSRGRTLGYLRRDGASVVYRVGYDLFDEVRYLLSEGQPASRALTPTLEVHIALLRHLILDAGVPVVEVPPRPYGHDFICCLTHDVDFFGIRRHKLDRTLAGFVARASIGTLIDVVRGRRSIGEAARNWWAVASLPLVFLGLTPDFWHPLNDYAQVERDGGQSTFFLVPFKERPGMAPGGTVEASRAVRYEAADVREDVRQAAARGSEIAVHGIDAWRDADAGRLEMAQLTSLTGHDTAGVRMHWLYFDQGSPRRLEEAGFDYDSTWGYNDAVGYRAGTSQVFRLPTSDNLMELPLSIMDSALFYPARMNLAREEALRLCRQIVANAGRFGGTIVVNWHDRSLAPERLWRRFYGQLLEEVQGHQAWFTTAGHAVDWFRWRRSIRFVDDVDPRRVSVVAPAPCPGLPSAFVRVRRPGGVPEGSVEEVRVDGREATTVFL